ncbi:MAG TPA: PQQ-binding-like beta-propeller repeat protein [Vicinamibacterales bacterium]
MHKTAANASLILFAITIALVTTMAQTPTSQAPRPYTTWSSYLGGADSAQYTALDQINRSNVSRLDVAWTFPAGSRTFLFGPLMADGLIFVLAGANDIVALDAATGVQVWSRSHAGAVGTRGLNYWRSADGSDRRLLYMAGGYLTAVDARTGGPIATFGNEGRVDLRTALAASGRDLTGVTPLQTSNPGRIFEDLIIMGLPSQGAGYDATPGDVHAYDVRTGALRWVFHSLPHDGEVGADTWPAGAWKTHGGVHNWSELSIDAARGIAYVPFGTGRFDFYGGDRPGDNLFANSLVALDARTGTRLWHHQLVHHDVWDYDLPTAPRLLTIRRNGQSVDVVAQPTKQGFLFVFNRVTGQPIWPIEERRVPQSDVPGERTSPTQPFPTRPAPFARQSFTERDINPYLPAEERAVIQARLRSYRNEGVFTPPSFEGSIQMPGHSGGTNWGGTAVDPSGGDLYVLSKALPTMIRILPPGGSAPGSSRTGPATILSRDEVERLKTQAREALPRGPIRFTSPYDFMFTSTNLSPIGPPWSEIVAYDLNTGDIRWRVPHGAVAAPASVGIGPDSGAHWPRGGLLATGGGLLFAASGSDRTFRAYDRRTGQVVWTRSLPAASDGVPASYEINGRQFIVVPVAAAHGWNPARFGPLPPAPPGSYIAFALPR